MVYVQNCALLVVLLFNSKCPRGERTVERKRLREKEAGYFFPRAKNILLAYGITETCSLLTYMTLYDPHFHFSYQPLHFHVGTYLNSVRRPRGICVGKLAPHVELRTDGDDFISIGTVLTRGLDWMIGYWDQFLASDSSSHSSIDTGDVSFIDKHGQLWLIGQESSRIKTRGANVYPEEVLDCNMHELA